MRLRPSRVAAVAIIAAVTTMIANCTRTAFAVLNLPAYIGSYQRHADIRYGTEPRQRLDVYVPTSTHSVLRPIVVFWYGGMWTRGAKERYRFVGAALAGAGYVAVLPDYRLYPQATFPQFVEDGARAVQWAREHAAEFGGDANALFLMGHSAGAHIAALLALDRRYLRALGGDTEWIRGWIGVSGPYAVDAHLAGLPVLRAIFHAPYSMADWEVIGLTKGRAPRTLLLHGAEDLDPPAVITLYRELRALGNHVECHIYDRTGHETTVLAFSLPFRLAASSLADVRNFIDRSVVAQGADAVRAGDVSVPCPQGNLPKVWQTAGDLSSESVSDSLATGGP